MTVKNNLEKVEVDKFNNELAVSKDLIAKGDFREALSHLMTAHKIGHASKKMHLQVHKLLIKLGWLMKSPQLILTQTGLFLAAWIFE